jgi:hypothetical protein
MNLAALYNPTAFGLLLYALIYAPVGQNRQLDEYIYHRRRTLKITKIVLLIYELFFLEKFKTNIYFSKNHFIL